MKRASGDVSVSEPVSLPAVTVTVTPPPPSTRLHSKLSARVDATTRHIIAELFIKQRIMLVRKPRRDMHTFYFNPFPRGNGLNAKFHLRFFRSAFV